MKEVTDLTLLWKRLRQFSFEGPTRSDSYLDWVRGLPCLECRTTRDVTAHHVFGSMGSLKSGDDDVLPLCPICHSKYQDDGSESVKFITLAALFIVKRSFIRMTLKSGRPDR
jgi:hypothetical protein